MWGRGSVLCGLIVAALWLLLFSLFFFIFIQTNGHYRLTAVCPHVGRNLLSVQITPSEPVTLFSLLPRTCIVECVSEWSHVLTGHYWRSRLPCWLTEWRMMWVSHRWVTANCQGFLYAATAAFSYWMLPEREGPIYEWKGSWVKRHLGGMSLSDTRNLIQIAKNWNLNEKPENSSCLCIIGTYTSWMVAK